MKPEEPKLHQDRGKYNTADKKSLDHNHGTESGFSRRGSWWSLSSSGFISRSDWVLRLWLSSDYPDSVLIMIQTASPVGRSTSFTSFTFTHLILVSCVVFSFVFAGRHSNISFSRVFSVTHTHTHTHTHTLVQPVRLTRRLSSSQRKHREQILRNTHSLCKWDAHTHLPHRHSDGKRSYWEMFDCVYSHINEINVLLLKAGVELV